MSLFSNNLKFLREKNNMTQLEFAESIGRKSISTISEWEKGLYSPKIGMVSEIAKFFGVSLSDITEKDLTNKIDDSNFLGIDIELFKKEIEKDPSFFGVIRGIVGTSEQERLFLPLFRTISDVSSVFDGKTPLEKIEVFKHIENKEKSNMFAVAVEDDKMSDVLPLDYIAIFEKGDFETGDIVFANCNGSNMIRRITRTKFAFLLEDEKGETIFIDCTGGNCDAVRIYGKLVFAYKEF